MVKIRALNESGPSDNEENTCNTGQRLFRTETQEENLQALYAQYLCCVQAHQENEARQLLLKLYDLINELDAEQASPVQRKLKFLTLRNLGDMFVKRIDFYIAALTLDDRDVILWIKTARRAFHSAKDYILARNCLQIALRLSPRNWIVIDMLIDCLYVLADLGECVRVCLYALKLDRSYFKGQLMVHQACNQVSYLRSHYRSDLEQLTNERLVESEKERASKILLPLDKLKMERLEEQCLESEASDDNQKDAAPKPKRLKQIHTWKPTSNLMSEVGEQLIRLYIEVRNRPMMLQETISVVIPERTSPTDCSQSSQSNEASQSQDKTPIIKINDNNPNNLDPDSCKNVIQESTTSNKETGNSRENSQLSRTNSLSRSRDEQFPFEFVDKRRSTRVQRIQNKGRDEQEGSVYDKITELFNACHCFLNDSNDNQKLISVGRTNTNESLTRKLNEANVLQQFFSTIEQKGAEFKLLDLFKLYLSIVCQNLDKLHAPSLFKDVYRIYRHHQPLLDVDMITFDSNFTLEDAMMVLCALELCYNRIEWYFLADFVENFGHFLSSQQRSAFQIRLVFARGVHENKVPLLESAHHTLSKMDPITITCANHFNLTCSEIKSQINAHSVNNLHSLLETDQCDLLFDLITPEMDLSDLELDVICKAFIQSKNYEKGVQFISQQRQTKWKDIHLQTLITCFQKSKNSSIEMDLIRKLIQQAKDGTTSVILSWTALLWALISNEETIADAHIIKFIELAHSHLGARGKCNEMDGQFLLLCLDYLVNYCHEMEDELVLQCFHCLFGYTRRGYSFVTHCSSSMKINWNSAEYVYSYFTPVQLPEFDTLYKNASINTEVKEFLREIVQLMPLEMHPQQYLSLLDRYLNNGIPFTPDRSNWEKNADKHALVMKNIFYFLADYYFKNKEFDQAILHYKLDLCLNPNRFDSWAATALSMNAQIDERILNDAPEYYQPKELFEKAARTIRCYSSALGLDKKNAKIWIEFGNLVYNIASYASKLKKTIPLLGASMEPKPQMSVDELEKKRKEMLKFTQYCFESSLQTNVEDEMWLHYYVLGKAHEKTDVLKALECYDLADKHLYISGAIYPKKISYSQHSLAIEALEVHYRIHAAVLKCILRENKISLRRLAKMKMHLLNALRSPFAVGTSKDSAEATERSMASTSLAVGPVDPGFSSIEELVRRVPRDVLCVVDDVVNVTCDRVSGNHNDIKITLVNLCLIAFKRCLSRFNNHYKSLYRLAHYFFNVGNLEMAKNVLMNSFEYNDLVTGTKSTIYGLFYERKPNNFFNGIWRIPVDDVERPGNFSRHMYNCIQLLIHVYTLDGDYSFLTLTLVVQLSRTPEVNKKYLRDGERLHLARKAFEAATTLLKSQLDQLTILGDVNRRQEKILETSRLFERLAKMNILANESNMIVENCHKLLNLNHLLQL